MRFTTTSLVALVATASAHIHMIDPVAIRAKENKYSGNHIDYDIDQPIASIAQVPCKGALEYLDQPEGTPVASYTQGNSYAMRLPMGTDHNGGSCQLSLSYDHGATFTVIKSFIGGCAKAGGSFPFTIPADAPTGKAVFGWSWNNRIGNREYYNNCAAVEIMQSYSTTPVTVPFTERPEVFVTNVDGATYCVAEGFDLVYPEPGPDVDYVTDRPGQPIDCASLQKTKAFQA